MGRPASVGRLGARCILQNAVNGRLVRHSCAPPPTAVRPDCPSVRSGAVRCCPVGPPPRSCSSHDRGEPQKAARPTSGSRALA